MKSWCFIFLLLLPLMSFAQDCENCAKKQSTTDIVSISTISDITKASLKLLCKEPYDHKKWEDLPSDIDPKNEQAVYVYLLRFSKPGGYSEILYGRYFLEILENAEYRKKFKKEFRLAFAQIAIVTKGKYQAQFENYFSEDPILPIVNDEENCQTAEELKASQEEAYKLAYERVKHYGLENATCGIPPILPVLMPYLSKLDKEKQKSLINPVYRGFAACLTEHSNGNIFISKSLVFAKNVVMRNFGHETPPLTHISQIGDKNVIILSNEQINSPDADRNSGIFYWEKKVDLTKSQKVDWETNGKKYSAEITAEKSKLDHYIDPSPAPDYKKMWEDKKLTGITLVSPNLGDFKDKVTSQYIAYYVDQGFNFQDPIEQKDSKKWIADAISSGEIDYVFKEAHSGGNDYDIIGITRTHKILTGTKKRTDGSIEVMHILMPQGDDQTERITHKDMSQWMHKREEKDKGPLLYINSSCWSDKIARKEISGIKSKLFIDIAADTKTTTFVNSKANTKYHIIDGIRNGETYDQMLKGMKTTKRYQEGANNFLFPHQDEYHAAIDTKTDTIRMSFEIQEDGKPYALHEAME